MLAGSMTWRFAFSTTNEAGAAPAPRGPTPNHAAAAHSTVAVAAARAAAAAVVIANPFEVEVRIVRDVMIMWLRGRYCGCVSPRAGAAGRQASETHWKRRG